MPSYGSNDGYGRQQLRERPSTRLTEIGRKQNDSSAMASLLAEEDLARARESEPAAEALGSGRRESSGSLLGVSTPSRPRTGSTSRNEVGLSPAPPSRQTPPRSRSSSTSLPPSSAICAACGKPVENAEAIDALGRKWHPSCFEDGGKPKAKGGAGVCFACGERLGREFCNALGQTWHNDCFVCGRCHKPLGEEPFVEHDRKPYHNRCHIESFGDRCKSCGNFIEGSYIKTERGDKYHDSCFTCATCGSNLEDGHVTVNGALYCVKHAQAARSLSRRRSSGEAAPVPSVLHPPAQENLPRQPEPLQTSLSDATAAPAPAIAPATTAEPAAAAAIALPNSSAPRPTGPSGATPSPKPAVGDDGTSSPLWICAFCTHVHFAEQPFCDRCARFRNRSAEPKPTEPSSATSPATHDPLAEELASTKAATAGGAQMPRRPSNDDPFTAGGFNTTPTALDEAPTPAANARTPEWICAFCKHAHNEQQAYCDGCAKFRNRAAEPIPVPLPSPAERIAIAIEASTTRSPVNKVAATLPPSHTTSRPASKLQAAREYGREMDPNLHSSEVAEAAQLAQRAAGIAAEKRAEADQAGALSKKKQEEAETATKAAKKAAEEAEAAQQAAADAEAQATEAEARAKEAETQATRATEALDNALEEEKEKALEAERKEKALEAEMHHTEAKTEAAHEDPMRSSSSALEANISQSPFDETLGTLNGSDLNSTKTPVHSSGKPIMERLKALSELHDAGLISAPEFAERKKAILDEL